MRRFRSFCGIITRTPKTIRHVVVDNDGSVMLHTYYSRGCIWLVHRYTKNKDACKGCACAGRYYCGYRCQVNVFDSVDPNATYKVHCKRVHEGDTLVGENGQMFRVKKRDSSQLYAERITI